MSESFIGNAHALSEPEHSQLQGLLRDYTTIVVNREWPLLGHHHSSPDASAAVRAIRENILHFPPTTDIEKAVYSGELTQVSNLFTARRARLDVASGSGVPSILLQGLISLGTLIVDRHPHCRPAAADPGLRSVRAVLDPAHLDASSSST